MSDDIIATVETSAALSPEAQTIVDDLGREIDASVTAACAKAGAARDAILIAVSALGAAHGVARRLFKDILGHDTVGIDDLFDDIMRQNAKDRKDRRNH